MKGYIVSQNMIPQEYDVAGIVSVSVSASFNNCCPALRIRHVADGVTGRDT